MKTMRFLKSVFVLGVVATCGFALAACSGNAGASGGVAATVNGVDIMEDEVTQLVHTYRVQNGLEDEENWGLYLAAVEQVPSDFRTSEIESLKNRELQKTGAAELGIELDTNEVELQLDSIKANYDSDEDKWAEALSKAGWTTDEYRAYVEQQVLSNQVYTYFQEKAEVTDDDLVEAAKTYGPYYYDGLKRSSHILFKVEDTTDEAAMKEAREKAQDVANRIKSGELSFEDAVAEYSDDSTKDKGGDVGWNNQTDLVSEYLDAVTDLDVDEVSDPVESQFGYHIIKVTEEFKMPEDLTSMDQIPEAFHEGVQEAAANTKAQSDYNDWLTGLSDNADFTQNDMPSGLPYDIADMAKYQEEYAAMQSESSADADSTEDADADAETDEAESDEAAAGDADDAASDEAAADEAESEPEESDSSQSADAE